MYGVKAVIWTSRGLYVTLDEGNKAGRRVRSAKLMQSTGLFDSSETPKEIFDGDIIRLEVPNQSMCGTYEVSRSNSGEWRIDSRTQGRRLYDSLNNITVIGNIHQHPHLLEENNG
ncbi:YopX family protein [Streptococcus suis]